MKWQSNKVARWIRWGLLALLLGWVTYESVMHQVLGGGKSPSIHAICPYGALESLYALIISGSFIQKIYAGTLILFIITLVIALLFRRSFCGLLCPFGALQEFFARLGRKIWKKRPVVPARLDRYLRYLKYAVLVLTLFMAWRLGRLWMSSYDPYSAYAHITAIPETLAEDPLSMIGFILLGVTLAGSFVYDRFFCKYLCPAGAFYAVVGKVSPTKIVRHDDVCIHCNLCSKACPVNLNVARLDKVTSAECLNCNECVAVCPKKGALEVQTLGKRVSPLAMLALVAGLFFLPIAVTQAAGLYQVLPESASGSSTTITSYEEIKGYMTIADAAQALGIAEDELRTVLQIPADIPADTRMSQLSTLIAGYDFDAAKESAAATESPAASGGETSTATTAESPAASGGETSTATIDVTSVRGSMTIADAAAAVGISEKAFYELFKIPASVSSSTRMKDIGNVVAGYDFDAVKNSLR